MSEIKKWEKIYFAIMKRWMDAHKGEPNWRVNKERYRQNYFKKNPRPDPTEKESEEMQKLKQVHETMMSKF